MNFIKYPSPNYNNRPDINDIDCIVIHYTDLLSLEDSLNILTDEKAQVSSHYVIDEDGSIYQLVEDEKRAWHAGISNLYGKDNVNHFSIGIELQNKGYQFGYAINGYYPPYDKRQIKSLKELLKHLIQKFPKITIDRIVGHSDICSHKIDPGPEFPWQEIRTEIKEFLSQLDY